MSRQVPPHGTEGRRKGTALRPPCACRICVRGDRIAHTRRKLNLLEGGRNLVPRDEIMGHVGELLASGMTLQSVASTAGVSPGTLRNLASGRFKTCRSAVADRLFAVRPDTFHPSSQRSALGSMRRVRALYAIGHGTNDVAAAGGMHRDSVNDLARGHITTLTERNVQRYKDAYRKLAGQQGPSKTAMRVAVRDGWAPPAAWDDDAIDDPMAHPDWTGTCGSDRGWWLHQIHRLTICAPCEAAHRAWLDELATVDHRERFAALAKAKAAASNRGEAIAENARELLRFDYTAEAAAERLGVTVNHLYQVLKRHPAPGTSTSTYEEAA